MGRIPKKPYESLVDGLQADLKGLIIRFIGTESVRYEEFAKIWRGLNFPLIFQGIKTEALLRTFTSEAFALAASSLLPPHDFQTRICSMYMLYGLYYTQPCSPKVKVRMDPTHWQALMNLSKELKEQGHLDAAYIFLKMHSDKIFQFAATLRHASYTRHKPDDGEYERWRAGRELMTTTFNPDLLEQLHGIHNHYQQMKQDMELQDNLSMKLVRESMADYIIQRIHVHQPSDDDEEDSEQERNVDPSSERAARIASIKKKSFSNKGQGSSSQRHLQEAATTSASEVDEKPSLSPNRPKRRGRKKRMKKVPGRKPGEKNRPATEMEKKKAWSILPMRRLIDVEDDEDSDGEGGRKTKERKKPTKTKLSIAETQGEKEKKKKKKKKKKNKKKKGSKSETDQSTAETSGDDISGVGGSATSGTEDTGSSPRKQRGRKRKRGSSTSEAEISDGKRSKKKGKKPSSDGEKDQDLGWLWQDGEEMGSKEGESPKKGETPQKGKSPKRQSTLCESDDQSLRFARSNLEEDEMTTASLTRRKRGRPKRSIMPEEDVTAFWKNVSGGAGGDDTHHVIGAGWVSDGGASAGEREQVHTGVHIDVRPETKEPLNRSPPKKVLLGLKKTKSQKDPVVKDQEIVEGGDMGCLALEKKEKKTDERRKSPRKSSRPRKVVQH